MFSGCYFGTQRRAKKVAYVMNGVAAAGGVVLIATSGRSGCDADVSCGVGQGMVGAAQATVGGILVAGAIIGTVINLATPTREAAPAPAPRAAPPTTTQVTAPGLAAATVELR